MKKSLLILIPIILQINSFAQSWSEPIQISTLQGANSYPDFYIANNGNIHCVWSYRIEQNHRIIFYSNSIDDGTTWSSPEDVSQNTNLWMDNPHIVADSQNHLHLTYDYNCINPGATLIIHRSFNGEYWSDADTVSSGWYGSRQNRLVIDNNDLLYCFWFHDYQNGTAIYRTLVDGNWGDICIPYNDYDEVSFQKGVVGSDNNIYCTGVHHYEGQYNSDNRYISFNFINNTWQPWEQLSDNTALGGNDIALSGSNHPAIVWRQYTSDSIPPDNGTLFSFYNGTSWSVPELIIENTNDQGVAIDMYDRVHIVINEEYENSEGLVHYRKINNEWVGEAVEEDDLGSYSIKIISRNQFLFMINVKVNSSVPDYNSSIVFRKFDVMTAIESSQTDNLESIKLYPNPTTNNLKIKYSKDKPGLSLIKIFDQRGRLIKILINKFQSSGTYNIQWNAMDSSGNLVNPGIYIILIKTGKKIITQRVILVN